MNKLICAFCVLALILLSVFLAFNPGFGGKTFKIESKNVRSSLNGQPLCQSCH